MIEVARELGFGSRSFIDQTIMTNHSTLIRNLRTRTIPASLMRPFTSTISLDEARRRLTANVAPIERTERVPLLEAAGRVAAADVAARSTCRRSRARRWTATPSSPPTRAARHETTPVRLPIVERIYTGQTAAARDRSRAPARRSPPARRCPTAPTPW